jgi:hypothetical protein
MLTQFKIPSKIGGGHTQTRREIKRHATHAINSKNAGHYPTADAPTKRGTRNGSGRAVQKPNRLQLVDSQTQLKA